MTWIRTVAPDEATGFLRRVYDDAIKRAGRVFHIVRTMSLTPRALGASMDLYKAVMFSPGTLSRRRREMRTAESNPVA